jgi:hypothetical protein
MMEPCTWTETCCSKATLSCDRRLLALYRFTEGLTLNTCNGFQPLNYSELAVESAKTTAKFKASERHVLSYNSSSCHLVLLLTQSSHNTYYNYSSWLHVSCGPGWFSRYSDSLRARRSGDRILVGARLSASVQTGPEAHPASYTKVTGLIAGDKAAGACCWPPPPPTRPNFDKQ